jgi:hypothetical protein
MMMTAINSFNPAYRTYNARPAFKGGEVQLTEQDKDEIRRTQKDLKGIQPDTQITVDDLLDIASQTQKMINEKTPHPTITIDNEKARIDRPEQMVNTMVKQGKMPAEIAAITITVMYVASKLHSGEGREISMSAFQATNLAGLLGEYEFNSDKREGRDKPVKTQQPTQP